MHDDDISIEVFDGDIQASFVRAPERAFAMLQEFVENIEIKALLEQRRNGKRARRMARDRKRRLPRS